MVNFGKPIFFLPPFSLTGTALTLYISFMRSATIGTVILKSMWYCVWSCPMMSIVQMKSSRSGTGLTSCFQLSTTHALSRAGGAGAGGAAPIDTGPLEGAGGVRFSWY